MMFHFNLHHITLILIGYLSNISCSPLPFGLLSSQVSGNRITFSHVELPFHISKGFDDAFEAQFFFRASFLHHVTDTKNMSMLLRGCFFLKWKQC